MSKKYRTRTGLPTLAQFMRRKRGLHKEGQTPAHWRINARKQTNTPAEVRVIVPDDIRSDAFHLQDYLVAAVRGPVLVFQRRTSRQIEAKILNPTMNINTLPS